MINDNEYLLFLHYAKGNGWYVPTGVIVGKVPVNLEENLIMNNNQDTFDLGYVENIVDEARDKYDMKK